MHTPRSLHRPHAESVFRSTKHEAARQVRALLCPARRQRRRRDRNRRAGRGRAMLCPCQRLAVVYSPSAGTRASTSPVRPEEKVLIACGLYCKAAAVIAVAPVVLRGPFWRQLGTHNGTCRFPGVRFVIQHQRTTSVESPSSTNRRCALPVWPVVSPVGTRSTVLPRRAAAPQFRRPSLRQLARVFVVVHALLRGNHSGYTTTECNWFYLCSTRPSVNRPTHGVCQL